MLKPVADRRFLLIFPGLLILLYTIAILYRVQVIPDLGLRTAFSTEVHHHRLIEPTQPVSGSIVLVSVGNMPMHTWVNVLQAPFELAKLRDEGDLAERFPEWARRVNVDGV